MGKEEFFNFNTSLFLILVTLFKVFTDLCEEVIFLLTARVVLSFTEHACTNLMAKYIL